MNGDWSRTSSVYRTLRAMRSRKAGLSGQGFWAIGHVVLYTPAIIAIDDLFYPPGPILPHVFGTVGRASIFLLLAYVLSSYLLFARGA